MSQMLKPVKNISSYYFDTALIIAHENTKRM